MHEIDHSEEQVHQVLGWTQAGGAGGKVHSDDVIRAHLAGDFGRKVIDNTAIHKEFIVFDDRGKDSRESGTGADGFRDLACLDHHPFTGEDIAGDCCEGVGEIRKIQPKNVRTNEIVHRVSEEQPQGGGKLSLTRLAQLAERII